MVLMLYRKLMVMILMCDIKFIASPRTKMILYLGDLKGSARILGPAD